MTRQSQRLRVPENLLQEVVERRGTNPLISPDEIYSLNHHLSNELPASQALIPPYSPPGPKGATLKGSKEVLRLQTHDHPESTLNLLAAALNHPSLLSPLRSVSLGLHGRLSRPSRQMDHTILPRGASLHMATPVAPTTLPSKDTGRGEVPR